MNEEAASSSRRKDMGLQRKGCWSKSLGGQAKRLRVGAVFSACRTSSDSQGGWEGNLH